MKTSFPIMAVVGLLTLALPGFAAPWVQTTSLPDGYADHALVYASGFLYQTGGASNTNGETDGTNVFYAQVHNDGTIGAWNNATPLPEFVNNHASVAANGFVYVIGGLHTSLTNLANPDVPSAVVYQAKISSDGSLGSWQTANPLPNSLWRFSASVWNNRIYVIGGLDENSLLVNTVYSATIQTNGSLSAWTTQAPFPVAIYTHASVANGFLYVVGGLINNGTQVENNSVYTKINADGTLAGWNETVPLPQPECFLCVVTANGWLFSVDGNSGTGPTSSFYSAVVKGDGSLGSWSTGTSLPQVLNQNAAAASDSYIFVSGGINTVENSSAVYSMALPVPPLLPTLVARSFTNGNFQLQLASSTNTGFGLLASPDMINWTNIGWGFTDTNGSLLFQDTNAASFPTRFYRAYWPLP
jgi:hypothetical protein